MPQSDILSVPRPTGGLEALVHRQRNRQPRGMLPSEKMQAPVLWTTSAQRDAMMLFELHHAVRSYRAWPTEAAVKVSDDCTYRVPLGITLGSGRLAAVDIVREEDEGSAARRTLDRLLPDALDGRGIDLIVLTERGLRADPRLPLARLALRSVGWPVGPEAAFSCVGLVRELGGTATLAELRSAVPSGSELVGTACVLAMRRVLSIDLGAPSLDQCKVCVPHRSGVAA